MRKGLFKEAAIVGGSVVAAGLIVRLVQRKLGLGRVEGDLLPIAGMLFATGAVAHLGWEAVGGNKKFAENYPTTLRGLDISEVGRRRFGK